MKHLAKIITRLKSFLLTQVQVTPLEHALASRLLLRNPESSRKDGPLIVLNCVNDRFFFTLFGELITGLRASGPVRVDRYISNSLMAGAYTSAWRYLSTRLEANALVDSKIRRLYGSYCDGNAWRALAWHAPWREVYYFYSAWVAWRGLKSKSDLFRLSIGGLWVGDLIIDSYLRFKPAAEVSLSDFALVLILRQIILRLDVNSVDFRLDQRDRMHAVMRLNVCDVR